MNGQLSVAIGSAQLTIAQQSPGSRLMIRSLGQFVKVGASLSATSRFWTASPNTEPEALRTCQVMVCIPEGMPDTTT